MEKLFQDKLTEIYAQDAVAILNSIRTSRYETFRINTIKYSEQEILSKLEAGGFAIKEGSFPNSYINVTPGKKISDQTVVPGDAIYIQGLSSMSSVYALDPKEQENILDLCAAPGSKTSLISMLTNLNSHVVAVETNTNRFNFMKRNLLDQGISNVETLKLNAVALPNVRPQYQQYFDRVLVDAPCSNEAMYRGGDLTKLSEWKPALAKNLSMLQKRLLGSAVSLAKPGAFIVYSTCTYSVEENEAVVNWALKKFPFLKLKELNWDALSLLDKRNGLTSWKGKEFDASLSKTVRVLPNPYFDAFFVSKLLVDGVLG